MKHLSTVLWSSASLLLSVQLVFGQLSGTKNIPGDYADLAAAISDVNTQGVGAGGVTLNLVAANPQTAPADGYVVGGVGSPVLTTTSSSNTITIQGNANNLTASATLTSGALNDAIFKLIGADWVTISGFTMLENPANTITTASSNNMTEWGVALLYVTTTDGAQNNTIQSNTIDLDRAYQNTFGIYSNSTHSATVVTTSATATGVAGGNDNLKIYGNSITDVNMGIVHVGPTAAADQNTTADIGGAAAATGNTITNFGTTGTFSGYANVSGTVNGILVRNTKSFNVSYNTVTSSNGGTTVGTLRGIYVPSFSVAPTGTFTNTINNNTISVRSAVAAGTISGIAVESSTSTITSTTHINNNDFNTIGHTVPATGAITLIFLAGSATAGPLNTNINSNTFTNLSVNNTGSFTFISNSWTHPAGSVVTVNNNSIVTAFNKTAAGGTVRFYDNFGSSPSTSSETNSGNNFSNVTLTGATTLDGWRSADGSSTSPFGPSKTVTNNTFENISAGTSAITSIMTIGSSNNTVSTNSVSGNTIQTISGGGAITIITSPQGAQNFFSNIISGVTSSGGSAVTAISITGGASSTQQIYKNKIFDISGTHASSSVNGILVSTVPATMNIFNNLIGDLRAPTASGTNVIRGISITGTTATTTLNISFNTVYLNASSSGANFGTSGLLHTFSTTATSASLVLRDNILVNTSTPAGTGLTVAFRRSASTNLNNYSTTSNNNLFYAGTPGVANLIFYDGTNSDQTIDAYKSRVTPRDAASFSENPTFVSTTGSNTNFLHINTSVATQIESGGAVVTGITDDYDGDTRNASTPDIGADEFNGTGIDLTPPSITYAPLTNTGSTANRTLATTITDPSGIGTGAGQPLIYFRKGSGGTWQSSAATTVVGNAYTLMINNGLLGGVAAGDTVQYYVAAQDNVSPTPNTGTIPLGGSGINPPGSTPPSSPNSYVILVVVSAFPYNEDFEGASSNDNLNTDDAGWTTGILTLTNNSWVRGTPAKTQIAAAHGGTKAFVTLTTGNYPVNEHSFLQTPVFDFSSLGADPTLSFWQNFKTDAGFDAGVLEHSTDGGSVWRRVDSTLGTGGTFNTPKSSGWYNSSRSSGIITPNKWSSSSTAYTGHASGWIQSTTALTGFAGKSDVRLRWRFSSDASTADEGWAIDDVAIVLGGTDVVAPVVTYSTFGYSSTSNLSLNNFATITDNVGVSNGPTAPRFYYKKSTDADAFVGNTSADNGWKYVVASNSSSPFSFTVDYSIVFGGSVAANDIIQYFVAAQDDANNLGSTPGGAGASSNPPIQNINAKSASVNSYVIKASLSGTKNIPGDYPSLTGAGGLFADINSKLLVGNMVVNITVDLTEDGTNALLQWIEEGAGGFTLTIQPDGAIERLISGSVANGMIRLDGVDRVTIDGRSGGTGRYLRFRNTNTSNSTLSIIGDVTYSTIRNCIVEGAGPSVVSIATAGTYLTGYRNATQNAITECQIRDRTDVTGVPTTLISVSEFGDGVPGGTSNTISNNEVFNFTAIGIDISGHIISNPTSWLISENTIYQTSPRTTSLIGISSDHTPGKPSRIIRQNTIRDLETSATAIGISFVEDNTYIGSPLTSIARNKIYSFPSTPGSTGSLVGILIQSTYGSSPVISNNQISLVPSSTNDQSIIGISCTGHHGVAYLYYNSILVGGTASGSTSTYAAQTATLYSPGFEMFYRISNNIFVNKRTSGTGNHGALRKLASATILHNLYAGTGAIPPNFMDWWAPFTFAQWLTAWNDITSYGTEASNINTNNLFIDPLSGNLNINPANSEAWLVNGRGLAGSSSGSIADDYGATAVRSTTSGTPTDIGSDEFAINEGVEPPVASMAGTITDGETTIFSSAGRTVGSIVWHGSSAPTSPMVLPTSVTFKYYPGTLPPPFITSQSNFIKSYWDISVPDGSGFTYDLTLNYTVAEINGIAEPNLGVAQRTGANPWIHQQGGVANTTLKTVFIGGLTSFSQFTLDDNQSPLPIQLASFTAIEIPNRGVRLHWITLSEINNYGFYVQRKPGNDSLFVEIPSSFIAGNGTTNEPHNYEFRDSTAGRGSWSYRLKQVDLDGTVHFTDAIQISVLTDVKESAPIEFALYQNYPNPFNPSTTIEFSLPKSTEATLKIFDLLGREIATLVNERLNAGTFKIEWDAKNMPSGTYFYRIQAGDFVATKKLILMK